MSPQREESLAASKERRAHRRYPVGLDLRYKLGRDHLILHEGSGTARDISEGGVFFQADRVLPTGLDAELSIHWPVRVKRGPGLQITLVGQIVRSSGLGVAVKIARSEFRAYAIAASFHE